MPTPDLEGRPPAATVADATTKARPARPLVRAAAGSMLLAAAAISGCASIAEGVTRGLARPEAEAKPLPCEITGPAFDGMETRLSRYETMFTAGRRGTSDIKVLMVHGIGTHPPGWSGRLQRNLSATLGLTITDQSPKLVRLSSPVYPGESIGDLTVRRYFNEPRTREMIAYELSWSEITTPKKQTLAFDTSGEARRNRAALNHTLKGFLNDRLSDPIAYLGRSGPRILESVSQSTCWMASSDWQDLPDGLPVVCDFANDAEAENLERDEFVFITHSLGSRIVTDSLQRRETRLEEILNADLSADEQQRLRDLVEVIKNKRLSVYMLANQLPLLDIATGPPEIAGQYDAFCRAEGSRYDERRLQELFIVAFSDPNDLLSYTLPPDYAQRELDSRVCPRTANVTVNVTPTINLFNIGEVAHPLKAHDLYDNDPRVIGIIAGGIGNELTLPIVREECTWLRTTDE